MFWSLPKTFTRRSLFNSSDHASQDNYVINWPDATILDRQSDKSTQWSKEAVHIRKEGRRSLNRNEGSYTLNHTYDRFLVTSHLYRGTDKGLWYRLKRQCNKIYQQLLRWTTVWPQYTWAEKTGVLCPFPSGELGSHLTQCHLGLGLPPYQVAS